jgi:hypothetical protein
MLEHRLFFKFKPEGIGEDSQKTIQGFDAQYVFT